jgi:hypothetical protein
MDRLKLSMAGCGLAALLAVTGCRSMRNEVPPGRPYSAEAQQPPAVGFSSDPHPQIGVGASALPGGPQGPTGQFGTPGMAGGPAYGAPTNNLYGPPGTSTVGSRTAHNDPLAATPPTNPPADSTSMPPGMGMPPAQAQGTPSSTPGTLPR